MADGSEYKGLLAPVLPAQYDTPEGKAFRAAFELVRNPKTWHQGAYSSRHGAYCSAGALRKVVGVPMYSLLTFEAPDNTYGKIVTAFRDCINGNICAYNDSHTHKEVVALWETVGKEQGWLV